MSKSKKKLLEKLSIVIDVLFFWSKTFGLGFVPAENLLSLKYKMQLYFVLFPSQKRKYQKELEFIKYKANLDFPFSFVFPYDFCFNYDHRKIKVFKNELNGLFYVLHGGKKLYYSRSFTTAEQVMLMYNSISIEQDELSPHRYLTDTFAVNQGDVVVDIGAAEGNFSLEIVEKVQELYIFEVDPQWIEALEETFKPWKEKVHIFNKYVSNVDNDTCVQLNTLFKDSKVDFIKMDVEGAEAAVLEGAGSILGANSYPKIALCTYHNDQDEKKLENILHKSKFNTELSHGFMLFIYSKLKPPYFRRGLIRAYK